MIELTYAQLFGFALSVFSLGLTIGLTLGYKFANKTVTTVNSFCDTPKDNRYGQIGITRVYANGKQTDIACLYYQGAKLCGHSQSKCKYF